MRLRHELGRANPSYPAISRCCATATGDGLVMLVQDVSYGYRMGAAKIAEMLGWCADAGIEMATIYLLSVENLQRDRQELAALMSIITEVVEQICAPANHWSVRTVGDLEVLGDEYARRLRDAVEERPALRSPVPFTSTSRWVTAGAGRSSTRCAHCSVRSWPTVPPPSSSSTR